MIEHKTIQFPGEGRVEEKKSIFLGKLVHVETEEEALAIVEETRKKHYDARHNCYAYIIGEKSDLVRASDDGEPQKTAGQPILSVLTGAELTNVVCVVTRYFGGTLLGTGGLVRAYTDAARLALEDTEIVVNKLGQILTIQTDYNGLGKLQYLFGNEGINIGNTEYGENVTITVCVPKEAVDRLTKKITDLTSGKALIEEGEEMYLSESLK